MVWGLSSTNGFRDYVGFEARKHILPLKEDKKKNPHPRTKLAGEEFFRPSQGGRIRFRASKSDRIRDSLGSLAKNPEKIQIKYFPDFSVMDFCVTSVFSSSKYKVLWKQWSIKYFY